LHGGEYKWGIDRMISFSEQLGIGTRTFLNKYPFQKGISRLYTLFLSVYPFVLFLPINLIDILSN